MTIKFVSYTMFYSVPGKRTYGIVADTNSRGNISVSPQTALCEIESFFFKILKFLLGS
jgi:hypothetical protein